MESDARRTVIEQRAPFQEALDRLEEAVERAGLSEDEVAEVWAEAAKLEALKAAARAVVSDVVAMVDSELVDGFGPFGSWQFDGLDSDVSVEWPNLSISIERLNEALAAFGREVRP